MPTPVNPEFRAASPFLGGDEPLEGEPQPGQIHAVSVHPHPDGKGYTVHHHHQPVGHPDHHSIGHVSSHHAEGDEELAEHMKEHAPKLHMAHKAKGMAMGTKVDTG